MGKMISKNFSVSTNMLNAMDEIAGVFGINTSEVFRNALIIGMTGYIKQIEDGRIAMSDVAKAWIQRKKELTKQYEHDIKYYKETKKELEDDIKYVKELEAKERELRRQRHEAKQQKK